MILLVSNKRDLTTDFIVLELRRRGLGFHRLNSEDLPGAKVRFAPKDGRGWEIDAGDGVLAMRDVRAAYYRRPGAPDPIGVEDPATLGYLRDEWSAAPSISARLSSRLDVSIAA